METTIQLFNVILLLVVFAIVAFVPYYSKKDILFGYRITMELAEHPEVKHLKRTYVIILLSVLTLSGVLILFLRNLFWIMVPIFIVADLITFISIRGKAWGFVKEHRGAINAEKKVVVSTVRRDVGVSPYWFLLNLVVLVMVFAITFIQFNHLPERIPARYDFQGNITGYLDKSLGSLLVMPIIQVIMTIILFFAYQGIGLAKAELSGSDLKAAEERSKLFKKRSAMIILYMSIVLNLLFLFIDMVILQIIPYSTSLILLIVLAIPVFVIFPPLILFIMMGQSGSRIKLPKEEKLQTEIVRADDEHWKVGMFYYNPADPSLWVEKRFGLGYTLNFARRGAWIMIGGLVVLLLVSLILPFILG